MTELCAQPGDDPAKFKGTSMSAVDWTQFKAFADDAGVTLPIEQTCAWDAYDEAVDGRSPWGRVVYRDSAGNARALVSLTKMYVRGIAYLWGKHAPVWLGNPPSAGEEADLRRLLIAGIKHRDPKIAFVRLHAHQRGEDCHELLQTMTYDRTIVLDLDKPDDEAILASFKSRGRRDVRKALRNDELTFADETNKAGEVFAELYEILTETGQRDGFRAAPEETYRTMLDALGAEHARLYVVRNKGAQALVWSLVTVWEDRATRYYAGSSALGRRLRAADALVYKEACWLRAEGIKQYDLMGIDSERTPELAGVREFKAKFVADGAATEVPGAWDVPVYPRLYRALVAAMSMKRRTSGYAHKLRAKLVRNKTDEK